MHNFARKPRSLRRKLHQYDVAVPIGPSKAVQAVPTFTTNQIHSDEEAFQFVRDNKSYIGDFFLLREENNAASLSATPMSSPNRTSSSNTTQRTTASPTRPPNNSNERSSSMKIHFKRDSVHKRVKYLFKVQKLTFQNLQNRLE